MHKQNESTEKLEKLLVVDDRDTEELSQHKQEVYEVIKRQMERETSQRLVELCGIAGYRSWYAEKLKAGFELDDSGVNTLHSPQMMAFNLGKFDQFKQMMLDLRVAYEDAGSEGKKAIQAIIMDWFAGADAVELDGVEELGCAEIAEPAPAVMLPEVTLDREVYEDDIIEDFDTGEEDGTE